MLKVKKIQPMFTSLITTMDKYEHDVTTRAEVITNGNKSFLNI